MIESAGPGAETSGENSHRNAGAFMRLPPDQRPTTSAMLTALDAALGGRITVLECLREKAQESRQIGFPVCALWEEHCYNAAPRTDEGLVPGSGSADASTSRPGSGTTVWS